MKKINEGDDIQDALYNWIKDYPEAKAMVSKVSSAISYDIGAAMSFCLRLLEAVNAHTEMQAVANTLEKHAGWLMRD